MKINYFILKYILNNVLWSNGERWKRLRSAANPIAVKPQNISLFMPQQDKITKNLVKLINKKFEKKHSIVLNKFEQTLRLLALDCKSFN